MWQREPPRHDHRGAARRPPRLWRARGTPTTTTPTTSTSPTTRTSSTAASRPRARPPYAVAQRTSRSSTARDVRYRGGPARPLVLVAVVRHPLRAPGPCPLIVFGHGFAVTPAPYASLLRAWARAGYVVAAPIFPLENANAPGGPDESDLVNQPRDMSVVITQRSGGLRGLIDRRRIGVSGQSDGGETALAVAYYVRSLTGVNAPRYPLRRQDPRAVGFSFPAPTRHCWRPRAPPTRSTRPCSPARSSMSRRRPKYLLTMFGAAPPAPVHDRAATPGDRRARDHRVFRPVRARRVRGVRGRRGRRGRSLRLGTSPGLPALRACLDT